MLDRTLILVKPDAFARHLTGEILTRFERKGLRLVAMKMMSVSEDLAREHYGEHEGRDFYEPLVTFITSGPIVAMILEGPRAIEAARQIIGSTDAVHAAPGSIRGDYALEVRRNLVHGSDSAESAAREIGLFFPDL
jgi:nucleoside-diphosphate kinase